MKYWFFNGSDVVGPFTPQKLAAEKAFNENSLVCPEAFSDEEDHWQPALAFEEFQRLLSPAGQVPPSLTLEQEMDSLLHETSPLSFEKTNTDNTGLQLPKKPAKPGPIEEYFNHIQKEDLGEILGIPDPAENSDMDLAHALEHQLEKTSSTRRKEHELIAADEETVEQLEPAEVPEAQQTHHVATATEVFATQAPIKTALTEPAADETPKTELPLLPANDFQGMPTADTAPVPTSAPAAAFSETPQAPAGAPNLHVNTPPVHAASQANAPEAATPAASQTAVAPGTQPAPKPTPAEPETTPGLHRQLPQASNDFFEPRSPAITAWFWKRSFFILLISLAVIGGTLAALHQLQASETPALPAAPETQPAVPAVQEPAAEKILPPVTPQAPAQPDKPQQALAIVQNHPLPAGRGPLAAYLNHIYQTQLSQGYTGAWEAQPLHKNTYIVKYRLTKPRKEPIIYVFQADIAQGKLTGALNNISLDLVGKI